MRPMRSAMLDLARRRLHPHRAREGAERVAGGRTPRLSQQPDHGHDGDGPPARRAHLRGGDHEGDDLRDRRLRPADDRRGQPAGLHVDPGVVLVAAAGYVVANLLVDVVYSLFNPRIRATSARSRPFWRSPGRRPAHPSRFRLLRKRFLRRPMAVAGLVVVVGFVVMAVFAPLLAPYSAGATDFNATLAHSSAKHLLGSGRARPRHALADHLGRARLDSFRPVLATLLGMAVAIPIGMLAGYPRGSVSTPWSRA